MLRFLLGDFHMVDVLDDKTMKDYDVIWEKHFARIKFLATEREDVKDKLLNWLSFLKSVLNFPPSLTFITSNLEHVSVYRSLKDPKQYLTISYSVERGPSICWEQDSGEAVYA
jgi:HSP90 family molecular chaperone